MELKDPKETLLNVANYLEAGLPNDAPRISHISFDLAIPGDVRDCGSVACIGGMAWIWENPDDNMRDASRYVGNIPTEHSLAPLFYPKLTQGFPEDAYYSDVSANDAATAIRRFFYGEPMFWDHVKAPEVADD